MRHKSSMLVAMAIALCLLGCNNAKKRKFPESVAILGKSKNIQALIELLKGTDKDKRKDAAIALGILGKEASGAVPHLYESLSGENATGVIFEGSYPNEVTTAIANIILALDSAGQKATAMADAAIRIEDSTSNTSAIAAAQWIWSSVLSKVGESAVPSICDYISKSDSAIVTKCFILSLYLAKTENNLGKNKQLAINTLQAASRHSDSTIREAAQQALKDIEK